MNAILFFGLLVLFITPLAMPGRRSLLGCGLVGAALFAGLWLDHLDWSRKWGADNESHALDSLYFWALGTFCAGIVLKLALSAWLARR